MIQYAFLTKTVQYQPANPVLFSDYSKELKSLKLSFQILKRGVFTHPLGIRAEARWGYNNEND